MITSDGALWIRTSYVGGEPFMRKIGDPEKPKESTHLVTSIDSVARERANKISQADLDYFKNADIYQVFLRGGLTREDVTERSRIFEETGLPIPGAIVNFGGSNRVVFKVEKSVVHGRTTGQPDILGKAKLPEVRHLSGQDLEFALDCAFRHAAEHEEIGLINE